MSIVTYYHSRVTKWSLPTSVRRRGGNGYLASALGKYAVLRCATEGINSGT